MEIEKLKQQNNLLNNQTAQLLKEKESEKNKKIIQGNLDQIEKIMR